MAFLQSWYSYLPIINDLNSLFLPPPQLGFNSFLYRPFKEFDILLFVSVVNLTPYRGDFSPTANLARILIASTCSGDNFFPFVKFLILLAGSRIAMLYFLSHLE